MNLRCVLAAGCGFVALTAGFAAEPLSLDQANLWALKKNERIQISEENVNAARESLRLVRTAVLPVLSTSVTQYRNKASGSGGFVTFRNNRDFRLELEQALYGGGKEWAVQRAAKLEQQISALEVRMVQQAVLFDVAVEYVSLLRAQDKLTVTRRALDLAREQHALAVARREAGAATRTEVIRADVTVSAAERDRVRAENEVAIFRARLGYVIGLPVPGDVQDVDDAPTDTPSPAVESLARQALRARPDYRISELTVNVAEEGITVARAGFFPSAKLSGNFSQTQHVTSFRDNANWQVQAAVDYDLFEGWGRNAEYEAARIRHRQAALELTQLARQIELEIQESILEWNALQSILETSNQEAMSARENHERVTAQYREGLSTAVEVADAHTAMAAAEVQLTTIAADLKLARIKFELALGTLGKKYFNL